MSASAGGPRKDRAAVCPGFRPRFFLDGPALGLDRQDLRYRRLAGIELPLPAEDARHARTVLRARPGDAAEVVLEPWRLLLPATFATLQPEVTVRLLERDPTGDQASGGHDAGAVQAGDARAGGRAGRPVERLAVALVQALPQPASVDLIVEKGTEVGVDLFVVAAAEGSPAVPTDRLEGRVRRWRRVASEAAKQSKQLARPRVVTAPSLRDAGAMVAGQLADQMGWTGGPVIHSIVLDPTAAGSLQAAIEDVAKREAVGGDLDWPYGVALWVGPEGGWSEDELAWFPVVGGMRARLGRRILKAETAGPVAAALVRSALREW